jgi:hypothetical protein
MGLNISATRTRCGAMPLINSSHFQKGVNIMVEARRSTQFLKKGLSRFLP